MNSTNDKQNQPSINSDSKTSIRLSGIIIFLALFIIFKYLDNGENSLYSIAIWFLLYLSAWITSSFLTQYKIGEYIHTIISIPVAIILAIGPFINAIGSILIAYIMIFIISIIILDVIPNRLLKLNINDSASLYTTLTFTSIIITTSGEGLIKLWHKMSEAETSTRDFQSKIALSIINNKRSKYLVYTLYFILLLIFNFCTLNNIVLFNGNKLDIAILQSFATFLAFDRLVSSKSLLKTADS